MIRRSDWQPRFGTGITTRTPMVRAVFHHAPERTLPDNPTRIEIAEQFLIIEDYHAKTLTPNNPRIGYNFGVIEQTGEVWELLGWNKIGAHVGGHNTLSLGILILGVDGRVESGSDRVWELISELIRNGIDSGALIENLELAPHNRYRATGCPGGVLERYIKSLTIKSLLALSSKPEVNIKSNNSLIVYSNFFQENLIVTNVVNDKEWYFIKESDLEFIGGQRKAATPLSQMPPAR